MSKHVFKHISIEDIGKPLKIKTSVFESKQLTDKLEENISSEDRSMESTVADLESEFAEKEKQLETEFIKKKEALEEEVNNIRKEAENWAFSKVKEATEHYEIKVVEGESLFTTKEKEAKEQAHSIVEKAQNEANKLEKEVYGKGFAEGREDGFNKGSEEVERLISRLNVILSSAVQKRNQVIEEAEAQIVDIVITIARKVVKSISESHKRVVYDNITEALRKLKGRAEVTIRVNTEDLQMTTKHKKEFIQMVEGIEQVRILEDNSVEKGGCYISTDFGTIDARISTQLSEIEEQIKKLSPQKEEL